jgi:hypothetical protein
MQQPEVPNVHFSLGGNYMKAIISAFSVIAALSWPMIGSAFPIDPAATSAVGVDARFVSPNIAWSTTTNKLTQIPGLAINLPRKNAAEQAAIVTLNLSNAAGEDCLFYVSVNGNTPIGPLRFYNQSMQTLIVSGTMVLQVPLTKSTQQVQAYGATGNEGGLECDVNPPYSLSAIMTSTVGN